MPLNETLPKTNRSKDWEDAANKKLGEIKKYAGNRQVFGLKSRPKYNDPLWKAMSDKEVQLRNKAMKLKRMGK